MTEVVAALRPLAKTSPGAGKLQGYWGKIRRWLLLLTMRPSGSEWVAQPRCHICDLAATLEKRVGAIREATDNEKPRRRDRHRGSPLWRGRPPRRDCITMATLAVSVCSERHCTMQTSWAEVLSRRLIRCQWAFRDIAVQPSPNTRQQMVLMIARTKDRCLRPR